MTRPLRPTPRLRWNTAFCLLSALALVSCEGCDLFGTKPITPKPSAIDPYRALLKPGARIMFQMTEVLRPLAGGEDSVLAEKSLEFSRIKDSVAGADTLILMEMRATGEGGILLHRSEFMLTFSPSGQSVLPGGSELRFFPFKIAAVAGSPPGFWRTLPRLLIAGDSWGDSSGIFTFTRAVTGLDTLEYGNRLEECWVVEEQVTHGAQPLLASRYWYGRSGLLRGEQSLARLDGMDVEGAPGRAWRYVRTLRLR